MGNLGISASSRYRVDEWTPTESSGLVAWYDSSDSATMTLTYNSTYNEDLVTQWGDKSGNGYHLVQSGGSPGPRYFSGGRNGRTYYSFPVNRQTALQTSSFSLSTNTVTLLCSGQISWNRTVSIGASTGGDSNNTNGALLLGFDLGTRYNNAVLFSNGTSDAWINHVVIRDGANWTNRRNGVQTATATSVTTAFAATELAVNVQVNSRNYPGDFGSSTLGEILLYSTALSTDDVVKAERYLAHKWGL